MGISRDKILGCIVGGAIGDCLGSAYEGMNDIDEVSVDVQWTMTDDTQMTLATCEALTSASEPNPEIIANRITEWYQAGRISRVGSSTLKALKDLSSGQHWALAGRSGEMAAGNGAAMRIAPIAFCVDIENEASRRIIRDVCRITHKNDEAYVGALAICLGISYAISGTWASDNNILKKISIQLPDTRVKDRLMVLSEYSDNTSLVDIAFEHGASGYVVESVPLALIGATRVNRLGFAEVLKQLIHCGGDTDTIASMAGQIMGALVGYENLPEQMIHRIPERDMIIRIASGFAAR